MDHTTLCVLATVFLATLIRSTFGFGEGLIAVPLLVLIIPIEIATPVVVLLSITIAGVVVVQDWRKIHFGSAGWMLAPTFVGIPLGIALLTSVHQNVVKAALAMVILAFAGYSLAGKKPPELRRDSRIWLLGCGFLAGLLGGAYGMNGPPLVIYGAMRRWSPQHFPAREHRGDGGILAGRIVGPRSDALLPDLSAGCASRHISWQTDEPSPSRRRISQICPCWPGLYRDAVADPGTCASVSCSRYADAPKISTPR